jgi:hypothetical protein
MKSLHLVSRRLIEHGRLAVFAPARELSAPALGLFETLPPAKPAKDNTMNRDEHKLFGEHLDKIGAALRDARAAHAVIRPDYNDPKSDIVRFFNAGKTLADCGRGYCGFYDKAAALNDDDDGDAGGTKNMSAEEFMGKER